MQPTRLYQNIAEKIKRDIEEGRFVKGDKLPSERDLAEQLQVSRTSVREAFLALEVSGYVDIKLGSGVYVKELTFEEPKLIAPSIHPLLEPFLKEQTEIAPFELLEARLQLEPYLAARAAENWEKDQLDNIKKAFLMNVEDNLNQSQDHIGDKLFHIRIAEAAQNSAYVFFLKYLFGQQYSDIFSGLQKRYTPNDMPLRSQVEHHKILLAIEQKNALAAEKAMREHIQSVIEIFSRKVE